MEFSIGKPKILVVADRPFWAYYYIQQFIVDQLSSEYEIYTDYICYYPPSPAPTIKSRISRAIYLLRNSKLRKTLPINERYDIVILLGFYFLEKSKLSVNARHIVKGIYTDGFPPQEADNSLSKNDFIERYFKDSIAIVCGSNSIKNRYCDYHPFVHYANCSLSDNIFHRLSPKTINLSTTFVIGWTGNPNRQFKGFNEYIIPAVEKAAILRPGIKLKTRFKGPIKSLPRFYDDIDVLLIASDADAGPSLFAEGGLCEVPSISTKIGFPNEVIKHGVNGLFVNRNISEMCNAIITLYDNRELLFSMSKKIRADVIWYLGKDINRTRWKNLINKILYT